MKKLLMLGVGLIALSFNQPGKMAVPGSTTAQTTHNTPRFFYSTIYQRSVYCYQDWTGHTGYEIWLQNSDQSHAHTVTVQVESRGEVGPPQYYTRTYYVAAGGETYVGCTLSGSGGGVSFKYIGYSYWVVGEV